MFSSRLWSADDAWLKFVAGLLIFLLPAGSVVVEHGASAPYTLLVLLSLLVLPFLPGRARLHRDEKILLLTFAAFFVWAIASMYISGVSDDAMRRLSRYSRFFTFIPVYFLIRRVQPSVNWLLSGVAAGAIVCGIYAILQIWFDTGSRVPGRANGAYHPVYFGMFSLLMAFLSISLMRVTRSIAVRAVLFAAFAMGMLASILSGTRGAWVAMPLLVLVVLWQYWGKLPDMVKTSIVLVLLVLPVVLYISPATRIADRIHEAKQDIQKYKKNISIETSLGQRFEMWRASMEMIRQHPFVGVGTGNYHREIVGKIEQDRYPKALANFGNPHNEYLNVFATRGLIGLFLLLSVFLVPLWLFVRHISSASRETSALAFSGVITILAYCVFSLSAAPFERVVPVSLYVFYVFVLSSLLHASVARHGDVHGY